MAKKTENILLVFAGLVIIGSGVGIYFIADTVNADSDSSRVKDLYWILNTFGKIPTVIMICAVGFIPLYMGIKKSIRK